MFNAIRGLLGRGADRLAVRAMAARSAAPGLGWGATAMGDLAGIGGKGLGRMSMMSNAGLSAAMGGVAGGMYGAASNDTSVLGGALMGMGLGAGAYGASRMGRMGVAAYRAGGGGAAGAKQTMWAMGGLARASIANIGPRLRSNSAINAIRGWGAGLRG